MNGQQPRIHLMKQILSSMNDVEDFSRQVGMAMEQVSTVSQHNADEVTRVNRNTQEMSQRLEDLSRMAAALETMAGGEQRLLAKFSLSENGEIHASATV